jgi:hypothetical protein
VRKGDFKENEEAKKVEPKVVSISSSEKRGF